MVSIRAYAATDSAALARLACAQFTISHGGLPAPLDVTAYLEHLRAADAAGAGALFVALVDEDLAGYVFISAPVLTAAAADNSDTYAMLSDLYVAPGYRLRGLGLALTRRAEQHARACGASRVALKVLAGNDDAVDFYRRLAYSDQFLVMERALDAV